MTPEQLKSTLKNLYIERDTLRGVYDDLRSQCKDLREENETLKQSTSSDADGDPTTPLTASQPEEPSDSNRRRSRVGSTASTSEDLERRYRAEMDRLQSELHSTANAFAETEAAHSNTQSQLEQVSHQLEETQAKAQEAEKLKDQVDELRHASDKLIKAEAVIEKYKKKLEEAGDLRRSVKVSLSDGSVRHHAQTLHSRL